MTPWPYMTFTQFHCVIMTNDTIGTCNVPNAYIHFTPQTQLFVNKKVRWRKLMVLGRTSLVLATTVLRSDCVNRVVAMNTAQQLASHDRRK